MGWGLRKFYFVYYVHYKRMEIRHYREEESDKYGRVICTIIISLFFQTSNAIKIGNHLFDAQ